MAITSLILAAVAAVGTALMSVGVMAVFAVGAGHVALNQIGRRREKGRGLAIAALAVGYSIAVLGLVSTVYFMAIFADRPM
ncbi:DUF4190 domain-containing protein [Arthrobacter sp. PAMC25284]|uniref:DUF4190 domain-containing protein n=1 Tax=Arthrobacter sp. PAMC25284 TaxID=2861279 RepID=UPI001C63A7B8|nr:DUF4190 domain-containing protein [Arthrobacter sp. PAMC25284]QYF91106.1 DUF4190 domain-containing protein [Arthrobacter sp. PAMC25284]